jgi:hypothetical protein
MEPIGVSQPMPFGATSPTLINLTPGKEEAKDEAIDPATDDIDSSDNTKVDSGKKIFSYSDYFF